MIPFLEKISEIEKRYIEFLYTSQCLKIGNFKLKSGRQSPYFIEMQESFDSLSLKIVGKAYAEKICELSFGSFNSILGPAEKGTAIALATALFLPSKYGKIPVFWDRKQPKDYGTQKRPSWIVGPYKQLEQIIKEQQTIKLIIVDDVITTGATKKEVMNKFEQEIVEIAKEQNINMARIEWVKMYIAINRKEKDEQGQNPIEIFKSELKIPIGWITDSYNIYGYLGSQGIIGKEEVLRFIEYQEKYGLEEDRERLEELVKYFK